MKLTSLANVIYPVQCYRCGVVQDDASYLCEECYGSYQKIGENDEHFCVHCSEPFEGAFSENPICPNCSQLEYSFDFARSALKNTSQAREIVHEFKYRKQQYLAAVLAKFCVQACREDERIRKWIENHGDDTVVVPVPLHWRRKFFRGFNQAELISRITAEQLGLRHVSLIKRRIYTSTQTKLTRKERLRNLNRAFSATKKPLKNVHFKRIILIDDVFTTGSTSEACASMLKKCYANIENIVVVTVLRG